MPRTTNCTRSRPWASPPPPWARMSSWCCCFGQIKKLAEGKIDQIDFPPEYAASAEEVTRLLKEKKVPKISRFQLSGIRCLHSRIMGSRAAVGAQVLGLSNLSLTSSDRWPAESIWRLKAFAVLRNVTRYRPVPRSGISPSPDVTTDSASIEATRESKPPSARRLTRQRSISSAVSVRPRPRNA